MSLAHTLFSSHHNCSDLDGQEPWVICPLTHNDPLLISITLGPFVRIPIFPITTTAYGHLTLSIITFKYKIKVTYILSLRMFTAYGLLKKNCLKINTVFTFRERNYSYQKVYDTRNYIEKFFMYLLIWSLKINEFVKVSHASPHPNHWNTCDELKLDEPVLCFPLSLHWHNLDHLYFLFNFE